MSIVRCSEILLLNGHKIIKSDPSQNGNANTNTDTDTDANANMLICSYANAKC